MSQFDPATLPLPLAAYFAAQDIRDTARLFAPHAIVRDEGASHNGTRAIATWLDRIETQLHPRHAVKAARTEAGRTVVAVEVSGTFPGSPLTLSQAFALRDGLITSLETL